MKKSLFFCISVMLCFAVESLGQFAFANPISDLFFSEYVEGSNYNKALEIYNGTGATVDLTAGNYNILMYFNGSNSLTYPPLYLIGSVADGDVFVVARDDADDPTILAQADQLDNNSWFNGNDAVVLRHGNTVIDVIGQIGFDPGSEWGSGLTGTSENTLRRKSTILMGDPDGSDAFDPSIEWDGFAQNTFDGLGTHTVTIPEPVPEPATMFLLGTGLVGVAGAARRKKKN